MHLATVIADLNMREEVERGKKRGERNMLRHLEHC